MPHDARLRDKVRTYYGTVGQYIEQELRRRPDRPFWEELSEGLTDDDTILDLGCGTGRITEILAAGGSRVLGVDLSRAMLLRARKCLDGRPNVSLVQADMRSFRADRRFQLIVAANDPFTHLVEDEDRDRALRTVARHLARPEGRFVLDGFWLGEEQLEKAAGSEGYRRERTVPSDEQRSEIRNSDPGLVIRETWRCEVESRRCRARFEYVRKGEVVDEASFACRLWSVKEVRARFARADLAVRRLLGGFDTRPFDPASATQLIVEAGWSGGGGRRPDP